MLSRRLLTFGIPVLLAAMFTSGQQIASAAEALTTSGSVQAIGNVDLKYTDGRVEKSQTLWTGAIPTAVVLAPGQENSCADLVVPIQASLSPADMRNVDVRFEVWTGAGEKLASTSIYGSASWNPGGGPTQARLFDCNWLPGNYSLYVTTQYQTATNGLISRYLEGKQTFSLTISPSPAQGKPTTALSALEQTYLTAMQRAWNDQKPKVKKTTCYAYKVAPKQVIKESVARVTTQESTKDVLSKPAWRRVITDYLAWACSGPGTTPR